MEVSLDYLIEIVDINGYLNDIERGILKFVNRDLYKMFRGYVTSINNLYYTRKYTKWYCRYFKLPSTGEK